MVMHDPYISTHTHAKVKVRGRLIQKLQWKQTHGDDGQTDTTDCIACPADAYV